MKVIAVANQKGGCAKTTTVVNLAAGLALRDFSVLVIDLDSQANATNWLAGSVSTPGSWQMLTTREDLASLIVPSSVSGVSLLAGSRELANLEKALAGELSVETLLKRRLAKLGKEAFDYVLIDTPPTLGLITLNALSAAQQLLIPLTTHVMSLSGVAQMFRTVDQVREVLNPDLNILGLVASRVDLRTRHAKDVLSTLSERFGDKLLKSYVYENVRLAEAPSFQQSILTYNPLSTAAQNYRDLADEVVALTSSFN
ncbi:MAG: ParA family protein [Burkholderiaceae bacterium]|jgi:chromosome partitioning protein|nr:ParA family protein [Burkholderiaceae bacterium]MDP4968521.1 ParA family protein [Burkholderiaceae bacterium]